MLDRQLELQHLAAAERHIREGQARIERVDRLIDYARSLGMQPREALDVAVCMRHVLRTLQMHRDAIAVTLQHIDADYL
jgi:uncharacterized protein YeeX (DUF496 family)